MSSVHQIEANRLNALSSTGPRTEAGKAASARNALKSGVDAESLFIHGESLGGLCLLSNEYTEHYRPATPPERTLVDSLIRHEWLLRRFTLVESHLWRLQMNELSEKDQLDKRTGLGQVYLQLDKTLSRLQRRVDSSERSFRTTLHELERLQAAAAQPDAEPAPPPDPAPQPIATEPTSPQIGFVPHSGAGDLVAGVPGPAAAPQIGNSPTASPVPGPRPPAPAAIGFVPQTSPTASPAPGPWPPAPVSIGVAL